MGKTLFLVTVATGLTLASSAAGAPGKYAQALAYSRCMRAHGLPAFPDPKQTAGGGIEISSGRSGLDPATPVYVSAEQSCRRLLPNGGEPTREGQQQALARMLHVSACMRAHHIAGFPDPMLAPPAGRASYSDLMSNDGVWLAIPGSIDVRSPLFLRAAASCNLGLS